MISFPKMDSLHRVAEKSFTMLGARDLDKNSFKSKKGKSSICLSLDRFAVMKLICITCVNIVHLQNLQGNTKLQNKWRILNIYDVSFKTSILTS